LLTHRQTDSDKNITSLAEVKKLGKERIFQPIMVSHCYTQNNYHNKLSDHKNRNPVFQDSYTKVLVLLVWYFYNDLNFLSCCSSKTS